MVKLSLNIIKDEGLGKFIAELRIDDNGRRALDRCGAGATRIEATKAAAANLAITRDNMIALKADVDADHLEHFESVIDQLGQIVERLKA